MGDDDGIAPPSAPGAVYLVELTGAAGVKSVHKVSQTSGAFHATLGTFDQFGAGLANAGDLDDDGVVDLAVASLADSEPVTKGGAVWLLFLRGASPPWLELGKGHASG